MKEDIVHKLEAIFSINDIWAIVTKQQKSIYYPINLIIRVHLNRV